MRREQRLLLPPQSLSGGGWGFLCFLGEGSESSGSTTSEELSCPRFPGTEKGPEEGEAGPGHGCRPKEAEPLPLAGEGGDGLINRAAPFAEIGVARAGSIRGVSCDSFS